MSTEYEIKLYGNSTARESQELKQNFDASVRFHLENKLCAPEDAPLFALQKLEDEFFETIPKPFRCLANWRVHFRNFAEASNIPAKKIEKEAIKRA